MLLTTYIPPQVSITVRKYPANLLVTFSPSSRSSINSFLSRGFRVTKCTSFIRNIGCFAMEIPRNKHRQIKVRILENMGWSSIVLRKSTFRFFFAQRFGLGSTARRVEFAYIRLVRSRLKTKNNLTNSCSPLEECLILSTWCKCQPLASSYCSEGAKTVW